MEQKDFQKKKKYERITYFERTFNSYLIGTPGFALKHCTTFKTRLKMQSIMSLIFVLSKN